MRSRTLVGVVGLGAAAVLALVGARVDAQAVGPYAIYQLGPPDVTQDQALALARKLKLKQLQTPPGTNSPDLLFTPKTKGSFTGGVRLIFSPQTGGVEFFPDLTNRKQRAVNPRGAVAAATKWLTLNGLLPADAAQDLKVGEIITTSNQQGSSKGKRGPKRDVLRTVHFFRQLDGLRVFGPRSIIAVDVSNLGAVGGRRSMLPEVQRTPVAIMSQAVATRIFTDQFTAFFNQTYANNGATFKVVNTDLIYYEQGQKYVQPAYRFSVQITGPKGDTLAGHEWLVPAVANPPEQIDNAPAAAQGTFPHFGPGTGSPEPRGVDPVQYGMYVVRDDAQGWINDAWFFHTNLDSSNFFWRFFFGGSTTTNNLQYYWDYPWFWEAAEGHSDQSGSFVGSVNVALIEGHGAPWEITTEKNCCDVIDLTQIAGYGGHNGHGGLTDYVIWQSCDVVPAPGDPYGGNFQSPASAFDVWFTIFKGLRGTYGYHTTMHIYNQVGEFFGSIAGLGTPTLSAWFTACDDGVFNHSNGWDYGSAVLISGHEGDTIYNTTALPTPGSLTIWWQHP